MSRERGAVRKEHGGRLKVALVYPNTYFVGMSNLGLQTLYNLFNAEKDCVCERAFVPDSIADLKGKKLRSIESSTPLCEFDVIAFSISFEQDYLNIPSILELSGIPIFSAQRTPNDPLVIAGGAAVSLNPEPIADMMDVFFIGEAENSVRTLISALCLFITERGEKLELFKKFSALEGIYVPCLYEFTYDEERVESVEPLFGAPMPVKGVKVKNISASFLPQTAILTPDTEFSSACLIEVERGCPRGCRFCAAGFLYLPPRERATDIIKESLDKVNGEPMRSMGRAGFVGAAVSEYAGLKELLKFSSDKGLEVTISSLRIDAIDEELLTLLKEGGYSTITIAPETGSERLRKVINKDIPDERIFAAVKTASLAGFRKIKLYFMLGLPTETDADARSIAELSIKIKHILKGARVTLSITPFIPKPLTPFQWHRFEDVRVIEKRYGIIKEILKKQGGFKVNTMPLEEALVQAYLSRGDRRVGRVIAGASNLGIRRFLKSIITDIERCVYRERNRREIFPWDLLDHGIKKEYLWKEYQRGLEGKTTPPCAVGRCFRCGVC